MTDKQTAPQQAGELVEVENFAPQPSLLDSIIRKAAWPVPTPSATAPAT